MRSSLPVRLLWILTDLHGNSVVWDSNRGGHVLWLYRRSVVHGYQRGGKSPDDPQASGSDHDDPQNSENEQITPGEEPEPEGHIMYGPPEQSVLAMLGTRLRQVSRRPRYCHAANWTDAQQHLSVWERVP